MGELLDYIYPNVNPNIAQSPGDSGSYSLSIPEINLDYFQPAITCIYPYIDRNYMDVISEYTVQITTLKFT